MFVQSYILISKFLEVKRLIALTANVAVAESALHQGVLNV